MPRCKNVPPSEKAVYYTKQENTPKGNGWCARFEEEGKVRKGTDGNQWIAKNGRWVKKKSTRKSNPKGEMMDNYKSDLQTIREYRPLEIPEHQRRGYVSPERLKIQLYSEIVRLCRILGVYVNPHSAEMISRLDVSYVNIIRNWLAMNLKEGKKDFDDLGSYIGESDPRQ